MSSLPTVTLDFTENPREGYLADSLSRDLYQLTQLYEASGFLFGDVHYNPDVRSAADSGPTMYFLFNETANPIQFAEYNGGKVEISREANGLLLAVPGTIDSLEAYLTTPGGEFKPFQECRHIDIIGEVLRPERDGSYKFTLLSQLLN